MSGGRLRRQSGAAALRAVPTALLHGLSAGRRAAQPQGMSPVGSTAGRPTAQQQGMSPVGSTAGRPTAQQQGRSPVGSTAGRPTAQQQDRSAGENGADFVTGTSCQWGFLENYRV